jgi:hypothetical protein
MQMRFSLDLFLEEPEWLRLGQVPKHLTGCRRRKLVSPILPNTSPRGAAGKPA